MKAHIGLQKMLWQRRGVPAFRHRESNERHHRQPTGVIPVQVLEWMQSKNWQPEFPGLRFFL
jgi:hypothetical protein